MKKGVAIGGLILVTVIWGGGFVASDMALESMKPFQIIDGQISAGIRPDGTGKHGTAEKRSKDSELRRMEYKRNWDRKNRPNRYSVINGETIQREHDTAAMILSREKYH